MNEKRFVLGIGAQKAATTWLYHYMRKQDAIDMGGMKEYGGLIRRYDGTVDAIRKLRRVRSRDDLLRWRMRGSLPFYIDYFTKKVSAPGIHTTGDITPQYSLLDESVLRSVQKGFASRGIRVRPIFVMRDPVERCWSAFRMNLETADGDTIRFRNRSMSFLEYCMETNFQGLTTYHKTLERCESIFPQEDMFIGFYETLFSEAEIERLSAWLGVPASHSQTSRKRNASVSIREIPPKDRASVAAHFRDVYEAIGEKYPEIRSIWDGFRSLPAAG